MYLLEEIWRWHPPVGVWIGLLGLIGVIVPLIWDVTRISKRKKAVWTAVMFVLLGLELKSIFQDRNEHDREQGAARAEELDHFERIAKGIGTSIDQITGGDQYCWLSPERLPNGSNTFWLRNSGDLPLERCYVAIHDASPVKSAADANKRFVPLFAKELGPVSPGTSQMISTGIILPCCSYTITILTRNDSFMELIDPPTPVKVIGSKGKWMYPEQLQAQLTKSK